MGERLSTTAGASRRPSPRVKLTFTRPGYIVELGVDAYLGGKETVLSRGSD
jgi:hypothetical protein